MLLRWWPRLLPGLAASATHGVIRTAHAVRSLREAGAAPHPLLVDELAQGMAFWAARYQTLPGSPRLADRLHVVTATRPLPRLDAAVPSEGPGVTGRLAAIDRLAGLPDALEAWGPTASPDSALDALVGAAAGCWPPAPTPRSRSATPSQRRPPSGWCCPSSRFRCSAPAWQPDVRWSVGSSPPSRRRGWRRRPDRSPATRRDVGEPDVRGHAFAGAVLTPRTKRYPSMDTSATMTSGTSATGETTLASPGSRNCRATSRR